VEEMTRRQLMTAAGASLAAGGLASIGARELDRLTGAAARPWRHAEAARAALQRRHLPNVPLVTHEGVDVRLYDDLVKDQKVVINFIDTHDLLTSSLVTANLAVLQRLLRSRVGGRGDIHMYSITSNPQRDTPAVLRAWAAQHGARPGWLFLTGKVADVERLRQALVIAYTDPNEDRD